MKKISLSFLTLVLLSFVHAQTEPDAGKWKPWFISSVKDYRLSPPAISKSETEEVIAIQQKSDAKTKAQIIYWNAGAPGYRWVNMMNNTWMDDAVNNGMLANLLMNVALYDATIAAWDNKYTYKRMRPFTADKRIKLLATNPASPSYPCEHSVAAGVAVAIFSHFFPKMTDSIKQLAAEQMQSRIAAGLAFPSDTKAGFELGKKIAEAEIEKTKNYLNKTPWDGKVPEGPNRWSGKFAMFANAGKSKTVVLDSPSQFRPGPPPDFANEMKEMKNYKQTFNSKANAFFYASQAFWEETLGKKIFEYNIHLNAPRAARIYAASAIGYYDGFVSCWDAKYAYWGIRPGQYDTTYKPLLPTPPFPGYPSGHAAISSISAELYAYFFPADKDYFRQKAKDVAESRFQGGIHFRTDNEVALELGKKVAAAIIEKIKSDGADTAAGKPGNTKPGSK